MDLNRKQIRAIIFYKVKVMPHPPYSHDIAPCDFCLFGELKKNLRGRQFTTQKDLD